MGEDEDGSFLYPLVITLSSVKKGRKSEMFASSRLVTSFHSPSSPSLSPSSHEIPFLPRSTVHLSIPPPLSTFIVFIFSKGFQILKCSEGGTRLIKSTQIVSIHLVLHIMIIMIIVGRSGCTEVDALVEAVG